MCTSCPLVRMNEFLWGWGVKWCQRCWCENGHKKLIVKVSWNTGKSCLVTSSNSPGCNLHHLFFFFTSEEMPWKPKRREKSNAWKLGRPFRVVFLFFQCVYLLGLMFVEGIFVHMKSMKNEYFCFVCFSIGFYLFKEIKIEMKMRWVGNVHSFD